MDVSQLCPDVRCGDATRVSAPQPDGAYPVRAGLPDHLVALLGAESRHRRVGSGAPPHSGRAAQIDLARGRVSASNGGYDNDPATATRSRVMEKLIKRRLEHRFVDAFDSRS